MSLVNDTWLERQGIISNHLKGVGAKVIRNTYQILFHDHLKNKMKSPGKYEKKQRKINLLDYFEIIHIFFIIHTHTKQENIYGICILTQEHKHIFTHTHTHTNTHIYKEAHTFSVTKLSLLLNNIFQK